MNTQVHLNSTSISILSIPKDRYWMFSSSILRLLHQEASKFYSDDSDNESSDEDDEDDDYSASDTSSDHEGTTYSNGTSATFTSASVGGGSGSGNGSSSRLGPTSPIDNTSKKSNSIDQVVVSDESDDEYTTEDTSASSDEEDDYFFHVAFTPQECTVMCSSTTMATLFREPLSVTEKLKDSKVQLLDETFITLQVDSSDGYDNSSKVLSLTKPLSTNNIPLFFLSTHFGDIVLIPESSKEKVVGILTSKNFEFSNLSNSYINIDRKYGSLADSNVTYNGNNKPDESGSAVADGGESPNLDIEQKAFDLFSQACVTPIINKSTKLLLTGARSHEVSRTILRTAQNLASTDIHSALFPEYFALTRTSLNEVSLLLPKSSKIRAKLGFPSKCIIGSTQDAIIPITIDLNALPLDSIGIVAGLASRLLSGSKRRSQYPLEMSYLSMAKSGIVMIPQENVELVSSILKDEVDHSLVYPIDNLRLE